MSPSTSGREELVRIARDWVTLWRAPVDWARFDALHADDFVDHASAGRPGTKAGFAQGLAAMVEAFPDLVTTVEDLLVDETRSRVAVRWKAVGTNRGRYLGVGPTNRLTTITGIEIVGIEDGRVVERWGEWDISGHLGSRP